MLDAATGGGGASSIKGNNPNNKFFLGTDSAPHARGTKEAACGCAGEKYLGSVGYIYCQCYKAVSR